MANATTSKLDVYGRKGLATRKRRAVGNKAARELMAALSAHAKAVAEARRAGVAAPFLVDFLGAK